MKKIIFLSLIIFSSIFGGVIISGTVQKYLLTQKTPIIINPPIIVNASKSTTSPISVSTGISMVEVAKHTSPGDCYLALNNSVYNVSSYLGSHPGGNRAITSRCGTEVTGIFARIHSNRAWDLLAKYKIGSKTNGIVKTNINLDLNSVEMGLKKSNPDAEIISVKPKKDLYISKIIYNGVLYEDHISKTGEILKEEAGNDEEDWFNWENDDDD